MLESEGSSESPLPTRPQGETANDGRSEAMQMIGDFARWTWQQGL